MPQNTKMLLGAVVAAALAFAVFYGLIGQQTANNIQTQTDQALGTSPASQQPGSQTQIPTTQPTVSTGPVPTNPAPAVRQ
jgi:hypothetical protein